jgi:hypothetical protein
MARPPRTPEEVRCYAARRASQAVSRQLTASDPEARARAARWAIRWGLRAGWPAAHEQWAKARAADPAADHGPGPAP